MQNVFRGKIMIKMTFRLKILSFDKVMRDQSF